MSRDTIVELLLQHGAEVNMVSDSGRTALSYACEHRCNDIVDILVKHASVDPDIPDSEGTAHPHRLRGAYSIRSYRCRSSYNHRHLT